MTGEPKSGEKALDRAHWSKVARQWIAWARSPNHDAFWAYRKALVSFIGPGDGEALDVGCGEGRVSRELKTLGYRVVAADAAIAMTTAAAEADSAHSYAVAGAEALPFADNHFDLVVAYSVLMDVADPPAALKEMARVMRPRGRLVMSIVHPFADCGAFADASPDAPFVLKEDYFGRRRFEGVEERAGLRMEFAGWSQPLESYALALEQAGLTIASLREPRPEQGDDWRHFARWTRVPLFLWLTARRA
ncbi:MAG TPA: class I SAM-dependent methyltransferase [Roseiarcus sp.]|nr:class I SAM-dependent methyltransferase [Roseiarcus sp.]